MFNMEAKEVRFVPGAGTAGQTDPSYHLPAFYELWARWGPQDDRAFWLQAATASRDLFAKAANPETGLCPDQCSYAGAAGRSSFQADAWRCQSNWSVDWSWFQKDPREQERSNKVQATFAAKGMDTYPEKMSLDAKTIISPRHVTGLVATNAAASLAATDPRAKDFTEALWNTPIPDGQDRYYSGCLYLMNYIHVAGKFRIW
jgi:oligosaccharide reducing-end xylanase